MRLYEFIIPTFILVSLHYAPRATGLFVRIAGLECRSVDPSFVTISKCKLKAIARAITELSVSAELLQKPLTNGSLQVSIYRRDFAKLPLIDYSVDICVFLKNKRRKTIANLLYKVFGFENHSNVNHPCPIDHDIVFERYRFNQNDIHLLSLPGGQYKIDTRWSSLNLLRATITVNLEVSDN